MFGERFRVARARAKMTMRDVAKLCGVTPQAVFKWEADTAMPSSGNLMKCCAAFDCSAEWLIASEPLDFHSTETAPQGRHAKYWVREAISELAEMGFIDRAERDAYRATLMDIAAIPHPDAVRSPHQEMARECVQKWETKA